MNPEASRNFALFRRFGKTGGVAWEAAVTVGSPNGCRAADLAVFPGI
jgi:hypothetical protein